MNRLAITTVLVASMTGACTSTHWIPRPPRASRPDLWMPKQSDRVTPLDERPAQATSPLPAAPMPASDARPPEAGLSLSSVPNARGYELKNRGRGAAEGLGLGILTGGLLGYAVGVSSGGDEPCSGDGGGCIMFSASFKGVVIGGIGALVGATVGTLIGFAVGHTDRYLFSDSPVAP
jgi:hypothetical protein